MGSCSGHDQTNTLDKDKVKQLLKLEHGITKNEIAKLAKAHCARASLHPQKSRYRGYQRISRGVILFQEQNSMFRHLLHLSMLLDLIRIVSP